MGYIPSVLVINQISPQKVEHLQQRTQQLHANQPLAVFKVEVKEKHGKQSIASICSFAHQLTW